MSTAAHRIVQIAKFIIFSHLRTTTTGDSDLVTNMRPFQIINAEKTIIARLRA